MTRNKIPTRRLLLQPRSRRDLLCVESTETGYDLPINFERRYGDRNHSFSGHGGGEELYKLCYVRENSRNLKENGIPLQGSGGRWK